MAVEYRLTLAGDIPLADVATRALPDAPDRIKPFEHLLTADLVEQGIDLTISAGHDGYFDAPGEAWLWEPTTYTDVTCRLTKDPDRYDTATRAVVDIVARVLATGSEDAALMLNGDYLLLTRTDGVVTKHRRQVWWDHYGWPNGVIPG